VGPNARKWKFDVRNDLAVYLGQPEGRVNGALVYYPFTGQILHRGDVTAITISEDAFQRFGPVSDNIRQRSATEVAASVNFNPDSILAGDDQLMDTGTTDASGGDQATTTAAPSESFADKAATTARDAKPKRVSFQAESNNNNN
jgi:hypothetical protein